MSDKWVGRILTQENLEISPQNLRAEPHPTTSGHESPEKLSLLAIGSDVREDRERCAEKQRRLHQVAKSGELNTARGEQGDEQVNAYHCAHRDRPSAGLLRRN